MDIWSTVSWTLLMITCAHIKVCLQWAKFHGNCIVEGSKLVIWSNASSLCFYSNDARHWVHHRTNEAFHEGCFQDVVQEQDASVMFWGCFTYIEFDPLVEVNKILNEQGCIQLLDEQILPFSFHICENPLMDKRFFQNDNYHVH